MKRKHTTPSIVLLLLLAFQTGAVAQSITFDSISATTFCAGDPVSATFTATGSWGRNNAFTLQLSDPTGSFTSGSATNLGSVIDSVAGKFTIISTIPIHAGSEPPTITISVHRDTLNHVTDTTYDTTGGTHYRVRVIAAYPYMASSDNGSDLIIGAVPLRYLWDDSMGHPSPILWATGITYSFRIVDASSLGYQDFGSADTILVDYGKGANPSTSTFSGPGAMGEITDPGIIHTIYSTTGLKTISIKTITQGGCFAATTMRLNIFDCSTPSIPNDAVIISQNGQKPTSGKTTYWVNPGITFQGAGGDTIFAETGANITGNFSNLVYLKPGASADTDLDGVVFYAPGAIVDPQFELAVKCDSLTFDYSTAPPNSVMHINEAVAPASPMPAIAMSPNPTEGVVSLWGVPARAEITVMNVLGETVQNITSANSITTLDLSKLTPGTYYIRIASNNGVVTKKVVKE